ncbi:MAG: glycosyltransferase family 2 protein [Akkermansiaceae bacterium]|nr:glycosyltransferase family 2 protein [Akkermansiaceae bacterium]MCP5549808.1 glycosyltransferase family 2 protein [Akkermansiaceae bacterium]
MESVLHRESPTLSGSAVAPFEEKSPPAATGERRARGKSRAVGRAFLVLPAYNEAESLPSLFRRLAATDFLTRLDVTVCVVDDGSADDTAAIAEAGFPGLKVKLFKHPKNMGLGQAMQTGIAEATQLAWEDDVVIAMDADDTHDVNLIPDLVSAIQDGADIAIASRFVEGGCDKTAPPFRRLLSRGASVVFKTVFPLKNVRDFTCGYRAYRVSLLKKANRHWGERLVEESGFACMMELLLKLRHWSPVIAEVPMVLRYDRKESASKLKLFRTLGQYLKLALRDRLTPAPRHA